MFVQQLLVWVSGSALVLINTS